VNVLCTFYESLPHVGLIAIQLQGTPKKATS
jgi:hypothetical protein